MHKKFTKEDVLIGISACLIGEKVRFDASNKPSNFCIHELSQHVTYKAYCPEVAVGMPIPRPTIRLIKVQAVAWSALKCIRRLAIRYKQKVLGFFLEK